MMQEVYVSTDVETDGPVPGIYSMLSFASVAFDESGKEIGSFTRNLMTLPDAKSDPDTVKWWETQPEAWEACRKDQSSPVAAMSDYTRWVESLPGKPVFVAYPAGFDFLFVYWYLVRFTGKSPFSFSALDIKTFAMARLGTPFRQTTKRNMPKAWFEGQPKHSHVAEDDARGQGLLFMAMLRDKNTPEDPAEYLTDDGDYLVVTETHGAWRVAWYIQEDADVGGCLGQETPDPEPPTDKSLWEMWQADRCAEPLAAGRDDFGFFFETHDQAVHARQAAADGLTAGKPPTPVDLDAIARRVAEMNWFHQKTDIVNVLRQDYEALVAEIRRLRRNQPCR